MMNTECNKYYDIGIHGNDISINSTFFVFCLGEYELWKLLFVMILVYIC